MARKLGLAALLGGALWAATGASSAYALNAAPTDLNFGAVQAIGTTSSPQAVLLHACSVSSGCSSSAPSGGIYQGFTNDCPNASLAFASSCKLSKDFSVSSDCPGSLAPGQPCTMNVRFKPSSRGTHVATLYTGTDVYSDACCTPPASVAGDKVFLFGIGAKGARKCSRKKSAKKRRKCRCAKKKTKKKRKKCRRKHRK